MGFLTFDWAMVAYTGSPLVTPCEYEFGQSGRGGRESGRGDRNCGGGKTAGWSWIWDLARMDLGCQFGELGPWE
jgi:hypothetical protein